MNFLVFRDFSKKFLNFSKFILDFFWIYLDFKIKTTSVLLHADVEDDAAGE